ncbi:hypothetical protein EAI_10658 [Harpegnathos saltator]|uniref:Uncharacterized protein n=1 Tax=Harpegnathos saltator TaxID=610380 RepID=E2BPD0_HARSA|nr:hypothetical protein EAI_10658 [Harpegnathos saltator]
MREIITSREVEYNLNSKECLGGYVILRTVRRSPSSIPQGSSGTTSFFTPQVLDQIVEEQLVAQATGALYQILKIRWLLQRLIPRPENCLGDLRFPQQYSS